MKVFWAVLALLVLASVAYLAIGGEGSRAAAPKADSPAPAGDLEPAPPRLPGQKDNDEGAFFTGEATEPRPAPDKPAADAAPSIDPAPEKPAEEVISTPAPAPAAEAPTPKVEAPAEVAGPPPTPTPAPAPPPDPKPEPSPAAVTPTTPPPAPKAAQTKVTFGDDAKVVKQDDGSVMVDDKYPLKGEGTKENPYQITWEYLISAQEDYQPRLGKKKLPGRMKLITGKYVKITGFVAFPIMATEPTEMLAMLNQWDGCCIGIPPTPYDAVEVKLKNPASNDDRLTTFATVEGKLTVEPYLVRDWLVSLYTMDEATMQRAQ